MKSAWRKTSRLDRHALGQRRLDLVQRGVERPGQGQGVDPGCFCTARTTAGRARDEPSPRRIASPCDLAERRPTVTGTPSRDGAPPSRRCPPACGPARRRGSGAPGPPRPASPPRRCGWSGPAARHVRERQAVGPQPGRREHDLVLLDPAADRDHLRHARHRQQPAADRRVGEPAQLHARVAASEVSGQG